MTKLTLFQVLFCLFLVSTSQVLAQEELLEELESIAIIDQKVMMPMRDGIRLCTDIYRPKTMNPCQLFSPERPIILICGGMEN